MEKLCHSQEIVLGLLLGEESEFDPKAKKFHAGAKGMDAVPIICTAKLGVKQ